MATYVRVAVRRLFGQSVESIPGRYPPYLWD